MARSGDGEEEGMGDEGAGGVESGSTRATREGRRGGPAGFLRQNPTLLDISKSLTIIVIFAPTF